jgi:hypothetical protein
MIPGKGAHISPCLVKYYRSSRGPEKAWDVSRISAREKDDVTFEEEIAFENPKNLRWRLTARRKKRQYLLPLQRFKGRRLLI